MPQKREVPTHKATWPNQVWSCDNTYLILDIFSRFIVGWEVWEEQLAENSSILIKRAALSQHIAQKSVLVLHSDNGSPMKGSTMLASLERLRITPSFRGEFPLLKLQKQHILNAGRGEVQGIGRLHLGCI